MRRKYRPYAALGAGLYLFIMWSAYHWEKTQHLPDGSIFEHREHERIQQFIEDQKEAQKRQADLQRALVTPESRLNAGPAFVAVRYDPSHVVFMVATDSESRFGHNYSTLQKIAAPAQTSAHLAGLEELWETDSSASRRLPESVKTVAPGDEWTLSLAPEATIPVTIARTVTAPAGCSLALGFLASVPEKLQSSFAASSQDYFVVRRNPVPLAENVPATTDPAPPNPSVTNSSVGDLPDWKPTTNFQNQIESLLNERMRQELTRIDATLHENAHSPDINPDPWLARNVRARRREWLHRDQLLSAGQGQLDYDFHAYRLTPDGAPRVFVRARWKLAATPVFLMTAWFREDKATQEKADTAHATVIEPQSQYEPRPILLSGDSHWSSALREDRPGDSLGDTLEFETILNQFDDDRDGFAELLVHSTDGKVSHFTLNLYTDLGLVATKTSFERSEASADSCAQPAQR